MDSPEGKRIWEQHDALRARSRELRTRAQQLERGECSMEDLRTLVETLAGELRAHIDDEEKLLATLRHAAWTSAWREQLDREHQTQRMLFRELQAACNEKSPPPTLAHITLALVEELLDDIFVEEAAFLGPAGGEPPRRASS